MSSLNVRVNAVTISSTPATLSPLRDVAWLRCVDSATSNDRPLSPDVNNQFNFHFQLTTSLKRLKAFMKTKKTNKTITDHSIGDQARLCSEETVNCFFN